MLPAWPPHTLSSGRTRGLCGSHPQGLQFWVCIHPKSVEIKFAMQGAQGVVIPQTLLGG